MARKKKTITVKGSIKKKQAQKKKGVSQQQSLTVNVITGRRKSSGKPSVKPAAKPPIIFNPTISPIINLAKPENTYTDYIKTPNATYSIERPIQKEIIKPFRDRIFPEDQPIIIDTNRPSSDYFFSGEAPKVSKGVLPPTVAELKGRTIGERISFQIPQMVATPNMIKPKVSFQGETPIESTSFATVGFNNPYTPISYAPVSSIFDSVPQLPDSVASLPRTLRSEQKQNKSSGNLTVAPLKARPTPAYLPLPFEESVDITPMLPAEDDYVSSRPVIALPPSVISKEQVELSDFPIDLNPEGLIIKPTVASRRKSGTKQLIMPVGSSEPVEPPYTTVRTKFDGRSSVGMPPASRPSKLKIMPVEGLLWDSEKSLPVSIPPSSSLMNDKRQRVDDEIIRKMPKSKPTIPFLNVDEDVVVAGDLNIRRGRGRPIKAVENPSVEDMRRLVRAQAERERYQRRVNERNRKANDFNNPPFEDEGV